MRLCYHRNKNKLKIDVLKAYGSKCRCCGETEVKFLVLDHVNNGGNEHRRQIGYHDIWRWAKRNNYPPLFQLLCANCNIAKAHFGICPHSVNVQEQPIP